MSKARPNGNAPTPPPRDIVREARRLARLQRLRLVVNEPEVDRARPAPPKEAA
jgi:hypothetical protein